MSHQHRLTLLALLLLGLVGLTGHPCWAQDDKDDPVVARMKRDIFFLASEDCEGRGVGTQGLDLAAEYIAAQFRKAGLKPGGVNGTYFQPFPFATGAQADGESTLVLRGPDGQKIALKQGVDFQVLNTSAPGKVSAPLVFAGYGVTARTIDYDDYKDLDVKGKAVITLRKLPRWNDMDKPFDGANKDALVALDVKQNGGERRQAAAVLLVNDTSELKDALSPFQPFRGISTVTTPFVQVKRAALEEAIKSGTGTSLADTEKAIDADLKPHSAPLKGWAIDLEVKIKRREIPVRNVVGYLDGAGPLANEIVVIGAHYDHLGYGGFGGGGAKDKIYFGADDNGSGSTSVIELARRFGALKDRTGRKLVFMTFTGEESGLVGSRHYARVAPLFPLKDTVAMVNLDMVGRLKEGKDGKQPTLYVGGRDSAKGLDAVVQKINPGFELANDRSVFTRSDHYSFYAQKIPVLFFFTGLHPEYHRPTDVPEKVNLPGLKRIVGFAERVVDHWRTDPNRPEYTPVK
jgi:hypothetical protein